MFNTFIKFYYYFLLKMLIVISVYATVAIIITISMIDTFWSPFVLNVL